MSVYSGSNWNLAVLVFLGRGKPEYPEKKNLSEQGEDRIPGGAVVRALASFHMWVDFVVGPPVTGRFANVSVRQ